MKAFTKISIASLIVIGITSAFSFAQYDTLLPKQGDKFTIATVANKIEQSSATFKWFNSYVVYSGRNISFKAKTPLTEKPQILTKTSKVIMFNSGSFPNANFPFVSNIIPKVGSLGVVSEVYVIDNDAGTYIGNKNVARGQLSAQLCIEAIYRTIDTAGSTSKTSNAYFIAKTADKASESYTLTENDNKLFTTDKYLTGCDNYYIAYCGDGIVDKKSGDAATDGQGGMSIDGTFLTWNLAPTTDEVCDEGTLNGTAGHCKTDCSGIGGEEPSGPFTVTKTLVSDKNYSLGESLQFRISFTNGTNQTVNNIQIDDYLPAGFTYVSSEISGAPAPYYFSTGSEGGNLKITYSGFSLTAGAAGYILINAKMASCNTTLNNVFWSAGSYSGYAQKLVSCPSNLVTKTTSKSTYLPGETAGFSINVTNTLSTTISNISLKDIWPSCASFTGTFTSTLAGVQGSQNGNISTWTIPGSLAAGQSFTISFYGSVSTNSACIGQFQTNTATLSYYDGSSTKENTTTVNFSIAQVSDVVDIKKIIISPKSGLAGPGDEVTYQITYTNLGSTSISNFRVIDIWPQSLDYVSSNYAPISRTDTSLVWSFSGPLQPGQKQIITVIGRVKSNIR